MTDEFDDLFEDLDDFEDPDPDEIARSIPRTLKTYQTGEPGDDFSDESFNIYMREIPDSDLPDRFQEYWVGLRMIPDRVVKEIIQQEKNGCEEDPETVGVDKIIKFAHKEYVQLLEEAKKLRYTGIDPGEIITEAFYLRAKNFPEEDSYTKLIIEDMNLRFEKQSNKTATHLVNLLAVYLILPEDVFSWLSGFVCSHNRFPEKHEYESQKHLVSDHEISVSDVTEMMLNNRNYLAKANRRLAIHHAKFYQNRGVSIEDLVQEGNLGLLKACEKFNVALNFRFSTYATWWIRQSISRYIAEHSRTIRIPVHLYETLSRLIKVQEACFQKTGHEPSNAEIALYSEFISDEDREVIQAHLDQKIQLEYEYQFRWDTARAKVEKIFKAAGEPLSLERAIDESESSSFGDFIDDGEGETPFNSAVHNMLKEQISKALGCLSEREREIMELRYGLKDGEEHTLEEISKLYSVTRERIRQIEAKALRKLRHPNRNYKLREYLD